MTSFYGILILLYYIANRVNVTNLFFRSWQSMKERFRKKILPVIHISFRKVLTKESLDNFEKYAKGLKVDTPPSTENSEDESIEREMNQALAQSTPITSRCSFTSFFGLSFKRYREVFIFSYKLRTYQLHTI